MKVRFYSPVIFVKNIEISKSFYMKNFEQEIEFDFGANIIFKSRLSLWQLAVNHEISEIAGNTEEKSFELYFETDDLAGMFARINATGVKLLHDIKTEAWGQKTFRFFDPDNHLVEVGESLNSFIVRIYDETGSELETAARTGVPLEQVKAAIQDKGE